MRRLRRRRGAPFPRPVAGPAAAHARRAVTRPAPVAVIRAGIGALVVLCGLGELVTGSAPLRRLIYSFATSPIVIIVVGEFVKGSAPLRPISIFIIVVVVVATTIFGTFATVSIATVAACTASAITVATNSTVAAAAAAAAAAAEIAL